MQCLICKEDNDRVVDSRSCGNGGAIRRRRECLSCGRRFTTYERPEVTFRMVIKKDGRRESFSREKLLRGMRIACQKRQVSTDQLARIAERIEADLFGECDREVSARAIGERVIGELKNLDQVAYVRFASVYREFTDVRDFAAALEALDQDVQRPNPVHERSGRRPPRSAVPPGPAAIQRKEGNGCHPGGP